MDIQQLEQERSIVQSVEQFLKEQGPFVSLAEAARLTGVPLPTLSDAVRHGRVPAVQVQPRRWLVRVSAVRSYFNSDEDNPHLALQQRLMAEGLLTEIKLEQHFEPFEPVPFKGRPVSEILIEERR
ncbi:MAG: helix-turn-helix domain-containing protein [Chloroflexi bacterium]|nr:helix-turn-helix domain-containing protein [Chloroflexota bacterium]